MTDLSITTCHASRLHGPGSAWLREEAHQVARTFGEFKARHDAELEKVCAANEALTARADRLQALLDESEARVSKLAGQLAAKPPQAEPNDAHTLAYGRQYAALRPEECSGAPAWVMAMFIPWHKRGPAWCHVVRTVQAAGRHGTPPGKLDSAPVAGGESAQGVG